jgi:hypothetical protein
MDVTDGQEKRILPPCDENLCAEVSVHERLEFRDDFDDQHSRLLAGNFDLSFLSVASRATSAEDTRDQLFGISLPG